MFGGVGGFRLGLEEASMHKHEPENTKQTNSTPGQERDSDEQEVCVLPTNNSPLHFKCVGYADINKYSVQCYNEQFGEHHEIKDVKTIDWSTEPEIDLLCAGFPCQSFSIAGKRRGFDDTRGTLFFEVARCIEQKQPRLLLLENVKGLLSHDKNQTYATILSTLDELGYYAEWQVLNSKYFGVPQNRERVFIVGRRIDKHGSEDSRIHLHQKELGKERHGGPERWSIQKRLQVEDAEERKKVVRSSVYVNNAIFPLFPNSMECRLSDVLEKQVEEKYFLSEKQVAGIMKGQSKPQFATGSDVANTFTTGGHSGGHHSSMTVIPCLTPDRPTKRQNGRRFKTDGEPSFTLTGQDIHGVAIMDLYNKKEHTDRSPCLTEPHHNTIRARIGQRIRRLTPTECERLQGFPDGWTKMLSDTQRYKAMGNAVTVNVIKAIGKALINNL